MCQKLILLAQYAFDQMDEHANPTHPAETGLGNLFNG